MAPGGRQPVCMEKIKTQKPASQNPPKPQPQCVSYSAAASGLLTSSQGTDALANLPGSWYYSTHATDTHPRGWVRRAGNTPPCAASFFPYSFFAGEERIWPPEGDSPAAWKILRRKDFQPHQKPSSHLRCRKLQRSGASAIRQPFGAASCTQKAPGIRRYAGGPPR